MPKRKRDAVGTKLASVPSVTRKRKITLPASAAAGVQLAADFKAAGTRIAAREARLTAEYKPNHAAVRAGKLFSINQLPEETVLLIGQQYADAKRSVRSIAAEHHIHGTTVYDLAAKRGWPKRTTIMQAQQRLLATADPAVIQAAVDKLNSGDAAASATHDEAELLDENGGADHPGLIDRQHLSTSSNRSTIAEQAARDELVQSYALACTEVLSIHRDLSQRAVTTASSLLEVFEQAIASAREEYKGNPRACAKVVSALAKDYHAMLGSLQRVIDMQRQAYALDDMAGKGMGPEHMQLMRAMRAGMVRPDQLAAIPPPPGQQGKAPGQGNEAGQKANVPFVIDGSYEELVRRAEATGVALQ